MQITVIPAKAGIQTPLPIADFDGVNPLDSGFRRNDEW